MSRKTIQISMPASGVPAPAGDPAGKKAGSVGVVDGFVDGVVDSWVTQAQVATGTVAEVALSRPSAGEGVTIKVRLSTQPDWAEAVKIFFFLPQAAMWFWTFGMVRSFTRGPSDWRL